MKNFDLEGYGADFAKTVLVEVFALVAAEQKKYGEEFARTLAMTLLASMTCTLVYNTLKKSSSKTKDVDLVNKDYQEYKLAIQNAISTGFETAFQQFSGNAPEYHTSITLVPEPVNKLVC